MKPRVPLRIASVVTALHFGGGLTRKTAPGMARPMMLLFVAFSTLDLMYFFAAPLVLKVPVVACLAWA